MLIAAWSWTPLGPTWPYSKPRGSEQGQAMSFLCRRTSQCRVVGPCPICIVMKNDLFNTQCGGVYQQMAKSFLKGFTWRWIMADTQYFCSFSIYHFPSISISILQPAQATGPLESACLSPSHVNTQVCAEP